MCPRVPASSLSRHRRKTVSISLWWSEAAGVRFLRNINKEERLAFHLQDGQVSLLLTLQPAQYISRCTNTEHYVIYFTFFFLVFRHVELPPAVCNTGRKCVIATLRYTALYSSTSAHLTHATVRLHNVDKDLMPVQFPKAAVVGASPASYPITA